MMPFVYGSDVYGDKPNKRRRLSKHLSSYTKMARNEDGDMADEQWQFDPELEQPASGLEKDRRIEFSSQVVRTSSREELMECIKRGQRPAWVPQPGFQALREEEEARHALRNSQSRLDHIVDSQTAINSARSLDKAIVSHDEKMKKQNQSMSRLPSALHAGDFARPSHDFSTLAWSDPFDQPGLAISTPGDVNETPSKWLSTSPRPTGHEHSRSLNLHTSSISRRRAPSSGSSLSSSFVMRAPTSPLVYATSNIDLDTSSTLGQSSPQLQSRRRTVPPNAFHTFADSPTDITPPNFSRPFAPALRRETSLPSQMHQSHRSLSSFTYHPKSNPQSPIPHGRRQSLTSEAGHRRRTSMVGSFEESILRGRMSTPPSKPLDFVAQIGVMGKGDCSANLKCPAHVSVPFPAVYYSYSASTSTRSITDDTPSPYVGTVDLKHSLKEVHLTPKKARSERVGDDNKVDRIRVGGAYRVPQQGQLQIIVKNPNKTAVKLFLVPYDLSGMDAMTKTFVRQRSFSSGPIIENALGNTQPKAADPLENKHILRYLVHLKFCCPARNRFYLYDDIRVVFANRVPDGKEKLRNELQIPEPKFSSWKSYIMEEPLPQAQDSAPNTPTLTTFDLTAPGLYKDMGDFQIPISPILSTSPNRPQSRKPNVPLFSMPSREYTLQSLNSLPSDTGSMPFIFPDIRPRTPTTENLPNRTLSPVTGFGVTTPPRRSPIPWRSPPSTGNNTTRSFSPIPADFGDSLLSRQFKELNSLSGSDKDTKET